MFYLKIYKKVEDTLVAVCDKEIIGKRYEEGDLQIEVSESFYKGDVVGEKGLIESLSKSTMANIVGNRAIATLLNRGLVDEENVISVGGVKHAQIVLVT